MTQQPADPYDYLIKDMDFRFSKPGIYGDLFYNQFFLDEECRFHRDEGPAIIDCDGTKIWFRHGLRHRDGDEPAYEAKNGDKAWYKDGQFNREGAPAIEYGDGRTEWWLKGVKLTDDEVTKYKEQLQAAKPATPATATPPKFTR